MSYVGKPATGRDRLHGILGLTDSPIETGSYKWHERVFRALCLAGSLAAAGYAISVAGEPNYPLAVLYAVFGLGLWLTGLADSINGMFD